jgi:NTE family protein
MGRKTSVSLVLGSGGARGLAHIGVIEWLEEHGYDIRSIAGSSMGALVGGIYAAGKLEAYKNWVTALDRADVVRMLDLSFRWSGLLKGERIIDKLRDLIGECEIQDLPIAYTAVASDIERGKEVWLSHGPLFDAIRASIAVPLVFTPYEIKGRKLLDGGLLNPLPVAPTLRDHTDITIAVNVDARPEREPGSRTDTRRDEPESDSGDDEHAEDDSDSLIDTYRERVQSFVKDLQGRISPRKDEEWGFFDIMIRSIETMQSTIGSMKMAAYTPDYRLVIHRDAARAYEFYRAGELIRLGREAAEKHLPG